MKRTILTLGAIASLIVTGPARSEDDAQAIAEAGAAAYIEAWQSGDGAAVAALYAEDAEFTDDSGTLISGRDAIAEQTAAAFAEIEGATLEIEVESARFLTPDVIAENGYSAVTIDGETTTTIYNATHVKQGETWLIAEVHETALPEPEEDLSAEALSRLEWLVGNWAVETESENPPTVEAKWVLGGKFIVRTTTIPDEESELITVELIGYDIIDDRIRSWVFDSEGGFGEGHWIEDGDTWTLQIRSTGPEGGVSSGSHSINFVDEDTVSIRSSNRVLDGEVLPNRGPFTLTRTEAASASAEE